MTKPRFTPDPLPDGLDPTLASYLQRQFDRINDWWPKDYEDRIQALENSVPYISGDWPIVDYAYTRFEGSVEAIQPIEVVAMIWNQNGTFYSTDGYDAWDWTINSATLLQLFDFTADDQGNIAGVRAGGKVTYSTDGATFTDVVLPGIDTGSIPGGIVYRDGEWIAVGQGTTGEGYPFKCWYSTNLADWTLRYSDANTALQSGSKLGIDASGNMIAACMAAGSGILRARRSTDGGATWSHPTTLSSLSWTPTACSYANDAWFISGTRKTVARSTDGVNFTVVSAGGGTNGGAGKVVHGGGYYLFAENRATGAVLTYSTNGAAWGEYAWYLSNPVCLSYNANYGWIYAGGNAVFTCDVAPTSAGAWTQIVPDPPYDSGLNAYGCIVFEQPTGA